MVIASCHCGNVQIEVEALPETLTACTCSICHRYGAHWAYYRESQVTLRFNPNTTAGYIRGEHIEFHHCRTCGCLTHYSSLIRDEPNPRLAINGRMFPRELTKDLTIRLFDGADTWDFIN